MRSSSWRTNLCRNIKTPLTRFLKWISKSKVCHVWSKLRWNSIKGKFKMTPELFSRSNKSTWWRTNQTNQNMLVFYFNSIRIDSTHKGWKRTKTEHLHWQRLNNLKETNKSENSSLINSIKFKQQMISNIQTTWNTYKEILERLLLFEMSKTISKTKNFKFKRIKSKIRKMLIKRIKTKAMSINSSQCRLERKNFLKSKRNKKNFESANIINSNRICSKWNKSRSEERKKCEKRVTLKILDIRLTRTRRSKLTVCWWANMNEK